MLESIEPIYVPSPQALCRTRPIADTVFAMKLRRLLVVSTFVSLSACGLFGPKGIPPECTQYLAQYECFLQKTGVPDHQKTIETMRHTWEESSKTAVGRKATLQSCEASSAQMAATFSKNGC